MSEAQESAAASSKYVKGLSDTKSYLSRLMQNGFLGSVGGLRGRNLGQWTKLAGLFFGLYFFVSLALGFFWSFEPDPFSVNAKAVELLKEHQSDTSQVEPTKTATGVVTTSALIGVSSTLWTKSGGYLSNDVFPPGVWLDNIPNWEYGVLIQVRDMAKSMREAFSRSQSQSLEDKDLALGESRFNFDHRSFLLPKTESEYREGVRYFRRYLERLNKTSEQGAQFYARADNLRYWLAAVESRLGSMSQNLSASVGQRRINTDLAGDPSARQATATANEVMAKTPWHKIDDVFYYARGSTWALIHFLKAIEVDFAQVLEDKNAKVSLQQIIRELEAAQQPIRSIMILNGSGFGMMANHSLVMASYISRANAAIIDLRALLSKG